jgi:hypothetical protein
MRSSLLENLKFSGRLGLESQSERAKAAHQYFFQPWKGREYSFFGKIGISFELRKVFLADSEGINDF